MSLTPDEREEAMWLLVDVPPLVARLCLDLAAEQDAARLSEEDREALAFTLELLDANPLGLLSSDPVVIEHNAKCATASAAIYRLLGKEGK